MRAIATAWIAGLALLAAPCFAQEEQYISARQVVDYLHSQDEAQHKVAEATIVITWQAFLTTQAALTAKKSDLVFCPAPGAEITDRELSDGLERMISENSQLADLPASTAMLVYLAKQYPCTADAQQKLQGAASH